MVVVDMRHVAFQTAYARSKDYIGSSHSCSNALDQTASRSGPRLWWRFESEHRGNVQVVRYQCSSIRPLARTKWLNVP
ncbi:hypothetical protein E1B28_001543 [Marasmius oreades]|uniref:Uncharacterized protein n=1 Tax=Marasmius oreades TaxID=181124 RepID=A0A9P7V3L6_9AGAR|nr:uncharacterized protein E1B28_001543 [Marasmius oreades]KAG7099726.1 hypothetical protein E1B28_001543 [Marasmius oreades]